MNKPDLDVVVITGFRFVDLMNCLRSLCLAARETDLFIRVLVGFNGARADEAENTIKAISSIDCPANLHITTQLFERRKVGEARNNLLITSSADWVFFCDDDIEVPDQIFNLWKAKVHDHAECEVFGGPNLTPINSSIFETIQGEVLGTLFGGGPFHRRYAQNQRAFRASSNSLTLCNLFVRRLEAKFAFPTDVLGGEELVFLRQFKRPFYFCPELAVTHRRRNTAAAFFRQAVKYGIGRRHASPHLAAAILITVLVGAIAVLYFEVSAMAIALYLALVICSSVAIAMRMLFRDQIGRQGFYLVVFKAIHLHIVLHCAYIWGLLKGNFASSREFASIRE